MINSKFIFHFYKMFYKNKKCDVSPERHGHTLENYDIYQKSTLPPTYNYLKIKQFNVCI